MNNFPKYLIFSTEKYDIIRNMKTQSDILNALRNGEFSLNPLTVRLAGIEPQTESDRLSYRPDAYVDIAWENRSYRCVADLKTAFTPKAIREAIYQVSQYAQVSEMWPLILTPYLSPERLEELEANAVSGIDLCGNGIVIIPGELLVVRTGKSNQYPSSRPIQNVYQGASSLVARAFLAEWLYDNELSETKNLEYDSVQSIRDKMSEYGGSVSLGTVSKVLKALEDDLIIRRDGRRSELLDPNELLDRLAANYKPPQAQRRKKYRYKKNIRTRFARLAVQINPKCKLIFTGEASVWKYAVMPREAMLQCYCEDISIIENILGEDLEETPRFPNLELIETRDPVVYFGERVVDGIPTASPVQAWLELSTGDKRQQEAAKLIRARIINHLLACDRQMR